MTHHLLAPAILHLTPSLDDQRKRDVERAQTHTETRENLTREAGLLSNLLRNLIATNHAPPATAAAPIPRILLQYWHDPAAIPHDVAECLHTWRDLSAQGFTHLLYHDAAAADFLRLHGTEHEQRAFSACHHPAMRCDYFRLAFLLHRGGYYVDADERRIGPFTPAPDGVALMLQPLCWQTAEPQVTVPAATWSRDPFASNTWFFYLNNNPLAAAPGHPMLRTCLDAATQAILSAHRAARRPHIPDTTGTGMLGRGFFDFLLRRLDAGPSGHAFMLRTDWERIAFSPWNLSYRADTRNWRQDTDFYGGKS